MVTLKLVDSRRARPNGTTLVSASELTPGTPAHRASATEGEAARRLLESQGFEIKRVANGQIETRCPFHEGSGAIEPKKGTKFYLHAQSGLYACHSASCGERGNLRTLERFFGIGEDDSYVTTFVSREEKLRHYEAQLTTALRKPFYEHGLNDVTIERFRLGYEPAHNNDEGKYIPGRYVIPYLEGRRPRVFRYYQPDGDPTWKYTWEKDAEAGLFNAQDAMGDKDGRVFICEGEQKAMLLVQLGYAAVAVPGANQWRDEFQAAFTHARHILVCYDNDNPDFHIYDKPDRRCNKCVAKGLDHCSGHNPGQDAALARVEQLGWRAKNIVLPLPNRDARKIDINDYFIRDGHTNADFAELATGKRATPFKVQSLADIRKAPPEETAFLVENGILPRAGRLLIAGKPKVGKAQPLTAPVLTPDGWLKMGDLRVGDQVIGADGRAAKIRQIHPQGRVAIYRVTLSDGATTECTAEHLWTVQTHNDRVAKRPGRTVDTQTIAEWLHAGRSRQTYLPMVEPVQFAPQVELSIDPYAMGVLLVSASLRGTPAVGTLQFRDALAAAFPDLDVRESGDTLHLAAPLGATRNPLIQQLRQLELYGTRVWERGIPQEYLTATVDERLAILQGLMDGSGWVQFNSAGNSSAHISTSSEQLRDGIAELVGSLGGVSRIRLRTPSAAQRDTARPSWMITLKLPGEMVPFRLADKRDKWLSGRTTNKDMRPQRKIIAVDYVRDDEAQCITIDREDGLYVTERYIVTHNSIFADNLALSLASGIPFLKKFKVDHPTRTLLLDRELSKWSLFTRMDELIADRPGYRAAEENLFIDHDHLLRLDQPNAGETLLKLIEENGAEVCILDTAYKFFSSDIESSSTLMKGFGVLDKVLHETGCAFVLTHHLRKGQGAKGKENTDTPDPDAVAGSFLWTGWPNATILLNYLQRSVENPFNAICTFTSFRDAAAPEPLALYRSRESIAYSAIQDYSFDDENSTPASMEGGRPTTETVAQLMLDLCPTTEDDLLHVAAARFGVSPANIKPYYLDAMASGFFEKTNAKPPIVRYRSARPDESSWEAEHGLPERKVPATDGAAAELFDAASLQ